jgi:hypothetical protein
VFVSAENLEGRPIERMHDVYSGYGQEEIAQAADPKGTRNPRSAARGVPSRSQEGREGQALNPAPLLPSTSPLEHLF